MPLISGEYASEYTGAEVDSYLKIVQDNKNSLKNLSDLINKLQSQIDRNDELTNIIENIQEILDATIINNILYIGEIVLKDGQLALGSRQGTNYTNNGVFDSSVIQIQRKDNGYIPIYSVKINNDVLSAGIDCNTSRFVWCYNGTVIKSLDKKGVWTTAGNDFAEFRLGEEVEAGRVVCENGDGTVSCSHKRLQPGASIVSDTYGSVIGQNKNSIPLAVAGRVLAYPYEDWWTFEPGEAVCAGPNGTVSKMSRREIRKYPERIIGTVSELPTYEKWNDIPVNGRIWITIK